MHKGWYIILIVCAAMMGVFIYNLLFMHQTNNSSMAKQGVIDFRYMEPTETPVFTLDGEWLFEDKHYIQVPGIWDLNNDRPFLNTGSGTYKLDIRLHRDQIGETLGLYIPNVASAYEVWIDGELKLSSGKIGETADDMLPTNYARTLYFIPKSERIELVIHVSNFSQRKGGLWDSIQFGSADAIALMHEKRIALQLLVVGTLLMMSIYLIIIYFLRRSQVSAFFLGLVTLAFAVRTLLIGDTFFIRVFPTFPWELQVKLEYLTMIVSIPLFTRYIHHLYPKDRLSKIQIYADIVALLFVCLVILTPALIYTHFLMLYQLLNMPIVFYLIYLFTIAMIRKRTTSKVNFISLVIFMAACLNDALLYLNYIDSVLLASKGFFVFLVSQTVVHAIKYSEAYRNIEQLTKELNELNQSLEQKVEERTIELKQVNERLRHVEHARKALISNVSHELSGPLTLIQGYVEAILDHKVPSEQKYWRIIDDKTRLLKRLIRDLSTLSELESRTIQMEFKIMPAAQLLEQIYEHYQGELEASGYDLRWDQKEPYNLPSQAYVVIDRDRIDQVFVNVIHNAVKYSGDVKDIEMVVEWSPAHANADDLADDERIGDLIVKVIDKGSGIAANELPHIFKRLYRGSGTMEKGTESRGLGLAISKEIMEIHNGDIWAESDIDRGSTFYILLPLYTDIAQPLN